MVVEASLLDYGWNGQIPHTEVYLLGPLQELLKEFGSRSTPADDRLQVLDLGCGNGALRTRIGVRPRRRRGRRCWRCVCCW